jgi:hypothetical protein
MYNVAIDVELLVIDGDPLLRANALTRDSVPIGDLDGEARVWWHLEANL